LIGHGVTTTSASNETWLRFPKRVCINGKFNPLLEKLGRLLQLWAIVEKARKRLGKESEKAVDARRWRNIRA
jgi:hypothetical protein